MRLLGFLETLLLGFALGWGAAHLFGGIAWAM